MGCVCPYMCMSIYIYIYLQWLRLKAQQMRTLAHTTQLPRIMTAFALLRAPPQHPLDLCSPLPLGSSSHVCQCSSSSRALGREASCPGPSPPPQHPAPLWPHFGMTEDIRLEPVESEAIRVLKLDRPPCQMDIERMLDLMPRALFKRGSNGSSYLVGGASPRCRESLLTLSIHLPYFNFAVNKYLCWAAPNHKYTTFVLRKGALEMPHRDTRNAPFPSLVQAFTTPNWETDGLWVQDPAGTIPKQHLDQTLMGRVQSLRMPFTFDARRLLHAGHVGDPTRSQERLVLVAFCTLHVSTFSDALRSRLFGLGFNVPSITECHVALHGSIPGTVPRLRQLTLSEFFALSEVESEQHDVIEVVEVHGSQSQ